MTARPVSIGLGTLGLIPFVVASLCAVFGESLLGADPIRLFTGYSAVILSFLSGTLWGKCMNVPDTVIVPGVLVVSNVLALLAWAALLAVDLPGVGIVALGIGYAAVLWVERHYDQQLSVTSDGRYIAMRSALTAVVIAMHVLLFANLIWSSE